MILFLIILLKQLLNLIIFFDAIKELETIARIYANNKNVVIEVVKYEFDKVVFKYEFVDKVIGLYGVDAAKIKKITSKNKKYGLIIA